MADLTGARLELAAAVMGRIVELAGERIPESDLDGILSLDSKLGAVLSSQWRKSWRDTSSWKETIWKNGAAASSAQAPRPALSRLEGLITDLRAAIETDKSVAG